jgi:trehalose-6-phosphatase
MPAGTPVAYVGDDLTDEAAFIALNQIPAPHLSVLMRGDARETAANIWLRPPSGLRGFLKKWYKALQNEGRRKKVA